MPLFSVAICTFNRYELLSKAIESVRAQDFPADNFDIWIMDNSPPSDIRRISVGKYSGIPHLNYVEIDRPGLSWARNLAVQHAKGDYILFMDDDAIAAPDMLTQYQHASEQLTPDINTVIGAIGGKVIPHFEIPKPAWLDNRLLTFLSLCDFGLDTRLLAEHEEPVGANVAFRRQSLFQIGGFNPSLGRIGFEGHSLLSGEESDCIRRLRGLGQKIGYTGKAVATHFIPAHRLTHSWFRKRSAWQATSDQMLYSLSDKAPAIFRAAIAEYQKLVPPEHQPMMGLNWDTGNPEIFFRQINAIGMLTRLMLAQGG